MLHTTLFNPQTADNIIVRINKLTPNTARQRGEMSVDQMLEHCARSIDMATGELKTKRVFIGYLLGRAFKEKFLREEIGHGRPTTDELKTTGIQFDFETEKNKLIQKITAFTTVSPDKVAMSVHPFLGKGPQNNGESGCINIWIIILSSLGCRKACLTSLQQIHCSHYSTLQSTKVRLSSIEIDISKPSHCGWFFILIFFISRKSGVRLQHT